MSPQGRYKAFYNRDVLTKHMHFKRLKAQAWGGLLLNWHHGRPLNAPEFGIYRPKRKVLFKACEGSLRPNLYQAKLRHLQGLSAGL